MFEHGPITIYRPDETKPIAGDNIYLLPYEHYYPFPWWSDSTLAVLNAMADFQLRNTTVIDYGCGASCILALAAVALGAKQVTAYEHIPAIADFARQQVAANNWQDRIIVLDEDDGSPADFLFANVGDAYLVGQLSPRSEHGVGTDINGGLITW